MTEWCAGKRAMMELLDHRSHRVSEVFIAGEGSQIQELKNKVLSLGITLTELSKEDFLELFSELPSLNHQWICGLITPATSVSSKQLFEKALKKDNPVIVALDQVQDPQNLGAIFRVCECAGVSGIVFPERRSAGVSTIVRRVSAGGTEFVPFSQVKNLAQAIKEAKKAGFWVYGTSLSEESEDLYLARIHHPSLLIFGSEQSGLRQQTEELCDSLIHLPQFGFLQSLNVASSVSAILFELQRRIRY